MNQQTAPFHTFSYLTLMGKKLNTKYFYITKHHHKLVLEPGLRKTNVVRSSDIKYKTINLK